MPFLYFRAMRILIGLIVFVLYPAFVQACSCDIRTQTMSEIVKQYDYIAHVRIKKKMPLTSADSSLTYGLSLIHI